MDRSPPKAIVEILSELPPGHHLGQVAVRRGHDAEIDHPRCRTSHRTDLMSLEGSQQLHLQRQRRVSNLVEKERPTGRALEEAFPGCNGAREGTAGVPEELALEDAPGKLRDRDRDEALSVALLVDGPGHELLAGARFTVDQDGRVRGGEASDGRLHPPHGRRRPDQPLCPAARCAGSGVSPP